VAVPLAPVARNLGTDKNTHKHAEHEPLTIVLYMHIARTKVNHGLSMYTYTIRALRSIMDSLCVPTTYDTDSNSCPGLAAARWFQQHLDFRSMCDRSSRGLDRSLGA
jgi:hypothetical protein